MTRIMSISMATRSVREHPGRFLVAISEGFIDKLLSEKTTAAMQACWWDHRSARRTCYSTTLLFDLVKLAGVRARDQQRGPFSILGSGNHGPVYISLKSGLLMCKYFTTGRGELVVPLKARLQGCVCF